jgi:hypothetical protein
VAVAQAAPVVPSPAGPELAPCQTPDALKLQADAACQALGEVPSTYELLDACGDGTYRRVDPKCVPPPEPSACTSGSVGDGVTCTDPNLLEKEAQEACLEQGLDLADVKPDPTGCGAGLAASGSYNCCPAPAPAAPAPASTCFMMELDVAACATHDDLTAQALAICATKGGVVTDVSYAHECPGGVLTALYTCCPP